MSQLRPPKTVQDKDLARVIQDIYDNLNSDRETLTQYTTIIQASGGGSGVSDRPITEGGLATGTQTIPASGIDGRVVASQLTQDAQKFITTIVFSASDTDTVAWAAGTIKLADGTSYAITASNTGNMTSPTYIYFDPKASATTLLITTTATDVADNGGIMLCYAQKTADAAQKAMYIPVVGVLGLNSTNIQAGSITTGLLSTNFLTAAQATIAYLSAITADMGSLTAGSIVVGSSNKLWLNDSADGALNIGGSTKASAPFRVTAAGALTATNATIQSGTSGQRIVISSSDNTFRFYNSTSEVITIGTNFDLGFGVGVDGISMPGTNTGIQVGPYGNGLIVDPVHSAHAFGKYTTYQVAQNETTIGYVDYFTIARANGDVPFEITQTPSYVTVRKQLNSTIATGTAPLVIASTTVCTNINADLLDGSHASAFAPSSGANYSNWDSAYTQRLQWDGGSTNLVAATGRTSLGLGTIAVEAAGTSGTFDIAGNSTITFVNGVVTAFT